MKITIEKSQGEYRVPAKDGREEGACYDTDKESAIGTAKKIYGDDVEIKYRSVPEFVGGKYEDKKKGKKKLKEDKSKEPLTKEYKDGYKFGKSGKAPKCPYTDKEEIRLWKLGYSDSQVEKVFREDNNFMKTLAVLQESTETLEESKASFKTVLRKGDNIYWVHDDGGIPQDVLEEIDQDTLQDVNAIIKKANGNLWISFDDHPMVDKAMWSLYHVKNRFGNKSNNLQSNYEGDDYVAQRLRSRR
jgi:ribosome modulation factor